MIKREFSKLFNLISSYDEKNLPPNIKASLFEKFNQSFSIIEESIQKKDEFLLNNLIKNDHEKKLMIFGVYLNNCGNCLKSFSLKTEDFQKKNCDLCFSEENFQEFYLECNGCKSMICTFCSSNLISSKNLPCLKCSDELTYPINLQQKKNCYFCSNKMKENSLNCERCDVKICCTCQKIIFIKIFRNSQLKKLTNDEKSIIEILKEKYTKYNILSIKKFLKEQALIYCNYASQTDLNNNKDISGFQSIDIQSSNEIISKDIGSPSNQKAMALELEGLFYSTKFSERSCDIKPDKTLQFSNFSIHHVRANSSTHDDNLAKKEALMTDNSNIEKINRASDNFKSLQDSSFDKTIASSFAVNSKFEDNNRNTFDQTVGFQSDNANKTCVSSSFNFHKKNVSFAQNQISDNIESSPYKTIKSEFSFKNKADEPYDSRDKTLANSLFSSERMPGAFNASSYSNEIQDNNPQNKTQVSSFSNQNISQPQQTILSSFGNKFERNSYITEESESNFPFKLNYSQNLLNNDFWNESSQLLTSCGIKPQTLYNIINDFENKLEKLCLENDFSDINAGVVNLFNLIVKNDCEFIYEPDPYQDDLYMYKHSSAIRKKLIGAGGYGSVYDFIIKDSLNKENDQVVGKTFYINQNNKNDFFFGFCSFLKEWKILRSFNHENIIKILGVFYRTDFNDDLKSVGMFLEKMDFSLEQCLNKMKKKWNFSEKLQVALQIAHGLNYIHENHRIHRDIKPGNILLDNKNKVKIIDFGTVSDDILEKNMIMDDAFTISYAPPEFIRYYYLNEKVELDFGSDIWSFGVTLYEIFTTNSGTLNFPWLKFLSDFEMKNIDNEKLRSNLCENGVLFVKEQEKLKEFVKKNLANDIKNKKIGILLENCFLMKSEERSRISEVIEGLNDLILSESENEEEEEEECGQKEKIKKSKKDNHSEIDKNERKEIFNKAVKRKNKF